MTVLRREQSQSLIASPEASFLAQRDVADAPDRACVHPSPSITGRVHGVSVLKAAVRSQLHGCRGEAPAGVQGQSPCPCGAPLRGVPSKTRGVSRTLLGGKPARPRGIARRGRACRCRCASPLRALSAWPWPPARRSTADVVAGSGRELWEREGVYTLQVSCVCQAARGCMAAQMKPVSSRAMATTTLPGIKPFSLRCR